MTHINDGLTSNHPSDPTKTLCTHQITLDYKRARPGEILLAIESWLEAAIQGGAQRTASHQRNRRLNVAIFLGNQLSKQSTAFMLSSLLSRQNSILHSSHQCRDQPS